MAIGVTWPIIVLKANEVIAPQDTPFRRIAVPKSSAGMAQLKGPLVRKKTAGSMLSAKGCERQILNARHDDSTDQN